MKYGRWSRITPTIILSETTGDFPAEMREGEPISPEQMLASRDERAAFQRELLQSGVQTLVCVTLNIPGPYKAFPLAKKTFLEAQKWARRQWESARIPVAGAWELEKPTGCEGFFLLDAPWQKVKALAVDIEESCPLGRLLDIDVLRSDGVKVSRQKLGLGMRSCLLCRCPAVLCARGGAHSPVRVAHKAVEIMKEHFTGEYADEVAGLATRALLYEVAATPKPGLVDRWNSGSHRDMDFYTFLDSSCVLTPYFKDIALAGAGFAGEPQALFAAIRHRGRMAEGAMLEATRGVNTHKGLIFSMGLLCAAAGYIHGRGLPGDADTLLNCCAQMTQPLAKDFEAAAGSIGQTAGERLYADYGITGIRGEAAAGFPSVRDYALPVMAGLVSKNVSANDIGVVVLIHLLANVCDTNIIHRSDIETQRDVQLEARRILSSSSDIKELLQAVKKLDDSFIRRNISAGGCADLLAVTWMVYFLTNRRDAAVRD